MATDLSKRTMITLASIAISLTIGLVLMQLVNAWVPQETKDKLTNDEMSFLNDKFQECNNKFLQYGLSPCEALREESIRITAKEHDNSTVIINRDIPLSEYCKLNITSIAEDMCEELN